jgi:ABC-2 type transport system permease protein
MRGFWPVFKRELLSYMSTPIAYVVATVFLVLSGFFFARIFGFFATYSIQAMRNPQLASQFNPTMYVLRPLLSNMSLVLIFILPLLTMRLLAEEKKTGSAEFLFTYPLKDLEIILGKFGAAVAIFLAMIVLTLTYPLLMTAVGADLEAGVVVMGYLGLILTGLAVLAMGTFFSSLTDNQIVAAVSTMGGALFFFVIGWGAEDISPLVGDIMRELSMMEHFDDFYRGAVDAGDLSYFLLFAAAFVFFTLRSLESTKWRS